MIVAFRRYLLIIFAVAIMLDVIIVDCRYLDPAYLEKPLISK